MKTRCALSTCKKTFEAKDRKKYCSASCRVRSSQIREKKPQLSKEDSEKVAKYLQQHGIGISDLINGLGKRNPGTVPSIGKKLTDVPKSDKIEGKGTTNMSYLQKRQQMKATGKKD